MGAEKQAVSSACLFPKDRCPSWRRVLVLIFPKPCCVGKACRDQGWRALSVCTAVKCDAGKEAKQLLSCLFNVCESFPCPQPPKLSQHLVNPLHAARPPFNWRHGGAVHGRETNLCSIKILSTHPSPRPSIDIWCSLPCVSLLPRLSFPLFSSFAGTSLRLVSSLGISP